MDAPTWIENALELLDTPGEWYLDRAAGFVYYFPRPGENLTTATVMAPRVSTLVHAASTASAPLHDVRLRGLTFTYATWLGPNAKTGYPSVQAGLLYTGTAAKPGVQKIPGAVTLEGAHHVTLERNVFEHLGSTALALDRLCQNDVVLGNVIRDVSGGAIALGDVIASPPTADPSTLTLNNALRDNYITDIGLEYHDAAGIFAGYVTGTVIEHNELYNLPYSGISVGYGWSQTLTAMKANRIEGNLVHSFLARLEDGAGIYTLSAQQGTTLQGNFVHGEIGPYAGLYLDNGSRGITVQGNVVSSVSN
jgi:Right handed beta helix region